MSQQIQNQPQTLSHRSSTVQFVCLVVRRSFDVFIDAFPRCRQEMSVEPGLQVCTPVLHGHPGSE